jgi:drug/metabolite transporter (DMT)-like permease
MEQLVADKPIEMTFGKRIKTDLLPRIALLTAVVLWGASFAATRIVLREVSPWSLMWLRMVIALICLLPFSKRIWPRHYRPGDWKRLLPMVLFIPCLYFYFESNALRFTSASQAGVISAAVPLFVAVGAWIFLAEPLRRSGLIGLLISMAGVAGMTLLQGDGGIAENPLLGNTLELCAMASASVSMLLIKWLSARYSPWTLTAFQVVAGTLFFLPGLNALQMDAMRQWSVEVVAAIFFLGGCVTLGAFGLYNWALSRIPASHAAAFINLVPVVAVAIGWGALGESLGLFQCFCAVAVIGGVWLSQWSGSRR